MRKGYLKPWVFGIIAGSMIVLAEAFAGFYPPAAYSFCLTCHTRDLVNTFMNGAFGLHFQTTTLARRILMLTSPSVLLGAFIAVHRYGEYRKQKSTRPLFFFAYGFVIMIVGIVIFGCPTRIAIRTGYGDVFGMVALSGMVLGIWIGTLFIRRRWSRSV
jgi:hypothetical protein